jgi:hypothetical protein
MELTIFAKYRTTSEGKGFYSYLTKLRKKDGEMYTVGVKFREICGAPKGDKCPCNIIVDKHDANLSTYKYVREDTGEEMEGKNLWITAWEEGSEYVDHSLDDFVD